MTTGAAARNARAAAGKKKAEHSFSPNRLNDVFGFATILASVDAAKVAFAHHFAEIPPAQAAFFFYFIVFRTKMYIDDAGHDFEEGGRVDILIACLSWLAFIVSAGSIRGDGASNDAPAEVAAIWFGVGLAFSQVWVVWTCVTRWRKGERQTWRHAAFALSNLVHLALLGWFVFAQHWLPLLVAAALVPLEAFVLKGAGPADREKVTLTLDRAVAAKFRERGRDWKKRMADTLRKEAGL